MKHFGVAVVLLGAFLALGGCSSSSGTTEPETVETAGPTRAQAALLVGEGGLVSAAMPSGASQTLDPGLTSISRMWAVPNGGGILLETTTPAGQALTLVGEDGSRSDLHVATDASYTVAWAPSGDSLLVGVQSEESGGLFTMALGTGRATDVGCSVSNIALSWGEDDWFVVSDGTNHYVVERAGCGTIETIDGRKLHHVTYEPAGRHVAFILRELEYDRDANEYRPDSSLYVAGADGSDPILVVGNRYKARNSTWSPDGVSLAFDAQLPDEDGRRLISIYDLDQKQSAFMNPGSVDSDISEFEPHWSPNGAAIAYMRQDDDDPPRLSVRAFASQHTSNVGERGERFAGWLDDNLLAVQSDTETRVVTINGDERLVMPGRYLAIGKSELTVTGTE